jgi:hypothetical protein
MSGSGGARPRASGAPRYPHGRAPGDVPRENRTPPAAPSMGRTRPEGPAYRALNRSNHRRDRDEGHAIARRPQRIVVPRDRTALRRGQSSATGLWHGRDRRPPRGTASLTGGTDDCRRCGRAASVTGISGRGDRREYSVAPGGIALSRHTVSMAPASSRTAHSPVKRCRMVVIRGTMGSFPV